MDNNEWRHVKSNPGAAHLWEMVYKKFTRIARKASPFRAGMDSAANAVRLIRLAFVAVLYIDESR